MILITKPIILLLAGMLSLSLVYSQTGTRKPKASTRKLQNNPSARVPAKIMSAFSLAYPAATVNGWQTEGADYKVLFTDNNMAQVAVYDTSAKVVRKETELEAVDIPAGIDEYYKANYPDKTGYKVWRSEDASGNRQYSSPVNDDIIYFNSEGKYLRGEKRDVKVATPPAGSKGRKTLRK